MNDHIKNSDPCPCGSGNKYEKCCKDKKTRQSGIHLNVEFPTIDISSLPKTTTGEYFLTSANLIPSRLRQSFTVTYEREQKKPKTVIEMPFIPSVSALDQGAYLATFDYIFAIDTNTKTVNDYNLSVTIVTACQIHEQNGSYTAECLFDLQCTSENEEDPEKVGWVKAIQSILLLDCFSYNHKALLITDHDQKNILRYNERDIPLLGVFYLPYNFTMMFATDTNDFLPNKLIRRCDKQATILLTNLLSTQIKQSFR